MIFYDIMIQDYQPEKAGAGKQVSRPAADCVLIVICPHLKPFILFMLRSIVERKF
jgi:hypothetical protein